MKSAAGREIPPASPAAPGPDKDTGPGEPPGRRPSRRPPWWKRRALPYFFLIPALLAELLIHLVPMAAGIGMSFFEFTQFYLRNWSEAPGPSLDNYRVTVDFGGPVGSGLLSSFGITLLLTVLVVGGSWLIGIVAAVLLQSAGRGRSLLRTVFLIPYALPVFAAVITWNFMLQRDTGAVNAILVDQLHLGGGDRPFWLIGDNAFWSMVAVSIWRLWPFAFLTFSAGLQTVPKDLYEAAAIDGAGVMRQIRSVTMPMLSGVNQVLIIVMFLWTFNDFTIPYTLFGKSAPPSADVVSIHIYQSSFVTWNFGLGSAMSVLLLVFLILAVALIVLVARIRRPHAEGRAAAPADEPVAARGGTS